MYCRNCGEKLEKKDKFCRRCGNPKEIVEEVYEEEEKPNQILSNSNIYVLLLIVFLSSLILLSICTLIV